MIKKIKDPYNGWGPLLRQFRKYLMEKKRKYIDMEDMAYFLFDAIGWWVEKSHGFTPNFKTQRNYWLAVLSNPELREGIFEAALSSKYSEQYKEAEWQRQTASLGDDAAEEINLRKASGRSFPHQGSDEQFPESMLPGQLDAQPQKTGEQDRDLEYAAKGDHRGSAVMIRKQDRPLPLIDQKRVKWDPVEGVADSMLGGNLIHDKESIENSLIGAIDAKYKHKESDPKAQADADRDAKFHMALLKAHTDWSNRQIARVVGRSPDMVDSLTKQINEVKAFDLEKQGYSQNQIAEMLGKTQPTVSVNLKRARRRVVEIKTACHIILFK